MATLKVIIELTIDADIDDDEEVRDEVYRKLEDGMASEELEYYVEENDEDEE